MNTRSPKPTNSLFDIFTQEHLPYCIWKSTRRFAEGQRGDTDIDILIREKDFQRFSQKVQHSGWIRLIAEPWRQYSGIFDFVKWNSQGKNWFHFHIYTKLIMGESLVKSLHLPIESLVLRQSVSSSGIHFISPELEYVLFIIRAVVKCSFPLNFTQTIWKRVWREHLLLRKQTTAKEVNTVLLFDEFSFLSAQSKASIERTLHSDKIRFSVQERIALHKDLQQYRSGTLLQRLLIYGKRLIQRQWHGTGKTIFSHTPSIAICGADGAGKSTVVRVLTKKLRSHIAVRFFYMGGNVLSAGFFRWGYQLVFLTPYTLLRKICTFFGFTKQRDVLDQIYSPIATFLMAREKKSRWQEAQKLQKKGVVILFERFPLFPHYGDSTFSEDIVHHSSALFFIRQEKSQYLSIGNPTITVFLDINPSVAAQRKPEHLNPLIAEKVSAFRKYFSGKNKNILVLDATLPVAELVSRILQQFSQRTIRRLK